MLWALQQIIIKYAQYIYEEGTFIASSHELRYPYKGPIFAFERDFDRDEEGEALKLIHNVELILPDGSACIPDNNGDFIEPKLNQVRAAFLKFQYWEDIINGSFNQDWNSPFDYPNILKKRMEIVKDKLTVIAIDMLKSIAESYSFREVDPDAGQVYWIYPGMQPPFAAYGLAVLAGKLRIGDSAPAELQLLIEQFNNNLEYFEQEIDSQYAIAEAHVKPCHPAREIANRLTRLINMWSLDVYRAIQYLVTNTETKIPYFKIGVSFVDRLRADTIPLSWSDSEKLEISFPLIDIVISRYNFYLREIDKEINGNRECAGISIIKDKLIPIAVDISEHIFSLYLLFIPDTEKSKCTNYYKNSVYVTNGRIGYAGNIEPDISLAIEQINYLIDKYQGEIVLKAAAGFARMGEIFPVKGNGTESSAGSFNADNAQAPEALPDAAKPESILEIKPKSLSKTKKTKRGRPNKNDRIIKCLYHWKIKEPVDLKSRENLRNAFAMMGKNGIDIPGYTGDTDWMNLIDSERPFALEKVMENLRQILLRAKKAKL